MQNRAVRSALVKVVDCGGEDKENGRKVGVPKASIYIILVGREQ